MSTPGGLIFIEQLPANRSNFPVKIYSCCPFIPHKSSPECWTCRATRTQRIVMIRARIALAFVGVEMVSSFISATHINGEYYTVSPPRLHFRTQRHDFCRRGYPLIHHVHVLLCPVCTCFIVSRLYTFLCVPFVHVLGKGRGCALC